MGRLLQKDVLGAMGVYRAAFISIEQTEPLAGRLTGHKGRVPVVGLGGGKGIGDKVLLMVKSIAKTRREKPSQIAGTSYRKNVQRSWYDISMSSAITIIAAKLYERVSLSGNGL